MRTLLTLLQIELRKSFKRKAFWIALVLFGGFLSLVYYGMLRSGGVIQMRGVKITIAASQLWNFMFGLPGVSVVSMAAFFMPISVILLTASEFTFKTSRQNIIDGLTRAQFWLAKVVSVALVAASYALGVALVGLFIGYVRLDAANTPGFITGATFQIFGSYFLMLFGYGLLGALFSVLARSSGAAAGLCFFYTIFIEDILNQLVRLNEWTKWLADAFPYFPGHIFRALAQPFRYDTAGLAVNFQQMAVGMNGGAPLVVTSTAFAFACGYVLLFLGVMYVLFKKTDL